jgi:hypothetical protein
MTNCSIRIVGYTELSSNMNLESIQNILETRLQHSLYIEDIL